MNSAIEILKFIKSHEGCGSQDMDYHTVLDLYDSGYVSGRNISTLSCLSFKNLRLTISGGEYLDSLKEAVVKKNHGAAPASNEPKYPVDVDKISLHKIAERFIGAVLLLSFVWVMFHYFGIRLY